MQCEITTFCFDREVLDLDEQIDFIAEVPSGLRGKAQLLTALRQVLRLPIYFGYNWDALAECLRDLHWIKNRRAIIAHHDLPQLAGREIGTYLQLLSEATKSWADQGVDHELIVLFPKSVSDAIAELLGKQ